MPTTRHPKVSTDEGARTHGAPPPRSPRALYREHFADARRERLFLSSVAFFLTFAIVRAITYAIHAGRGPLHDVVVGGMHLHHLVLGILLLLLGVGYLWLAQVGTGIGHALDWPPELTALLYGVGAAFVGRKGLVRQRPSLRLLSAPSRSAAITKRFR